jgi:pyruvate dehydrogenase E1 component alpha subunit
MHAPAVFVCNNNQWAISTPIEAQTRVESLADKAVGYGIPGVTVDGLDVLAVYGAARDAVERARSGAGPTLIECVHYRAAPHATADDPSAYIDLARVEAERVNECLGRFERQLLDAGILTEERVAAARKEAEDLLRAGINAAEAEPPADPELVFTHAYVDPPENMRNG